VTMPRYFHGVVSRFSAGRRSLSLGDRQAVTSFLQRSGISFQGIQQFLGGEGVANVGDRHKLAAKVGELLAPMRGGQIHGNAFLSDALDEKLIEQKRYLRLAPRKVLKVLRWERHALRLPFAGFARFKLSQCRSAGCFQGRSAGLLTGLGRSR
jgi:hypothetical protein